MNSAEGLTARYLARDSQLRIERPRSERAEMMSFALNSNGWIKTVDTGWQFNSEVAHSIGYEFGGLRTAFYGPGGQGPVFSPDYRPIQPSLSISFSDPVVLNTIQKFRDVDEDLGVRIAFMLGGIVRTMETQFDNKTLKEFIGSPFDEEEKVEAITKAVNFAARMTRMAGPESADAVVNAMTMYYASGGKAEGDSLLAEWVYHMTEAISDDPILPSSTIELGLSQTARLRSFTKRLLGEEPTKLPDISDQMSDFFGFPTIGAEFHFAFDEAVRHPRFLERLAVLNMSQYQEGSYIQFSRNDRGIYEVRMNPSSPPITVANWRQIKMVLPELADAYFTFTMNREAKGSDFTWNHKKDEQVIRQLSGLGLLCYAASYQNVPPATSDEINFGNAYLGQTVRLVDDGYSFTGNWSGKEGKDGQLGLYVGFGNSMPHLASYIPYMFMLNDPTKFPSLRRIQSIGDAMRLSSPQRRDILTAIKRELCYNPQTRDAVRSHDTIQQKLTV